MLTDELTKELQEILREDYGLDLGEKETQLVGDELVSSYETLIKLYLAGKDEV